MKWKLRPPVLAVLSLCLAGCVGQRLEPGAETICPALPNELTARFERLPDAPAPRVDLSDQTLPALSERYLRTIEREALLRKKYALAQRLPDEIEAAYQALRALHPVECGGLGGVEK